VIDLVWKGFQKKILGRQGRFLVQCKCLSHNGFLTSRGYREVAQRERDLRGVDGMSTLWYLDNRVSVSALDGDGDLYADWCDHKIDQQYRRFLNGS